MSCRVCRRRAAKPKMTSVTIRQLVAGLKDLLRALLFALVFSLTFLIMLPALVENRVPVSLWPVYVLSALLN